MIFSTEQWSALFDQVEEVFTSSTIEDEDETSNFSVEDIVDIVKIFLEETSNKLLLSHPHIASALREISSDLE